MCGIVGLRLKNPDLRPILGKLAVPMVDVLASRGPDSTGVAIYNHDVPPGATKYSLSAPADDYDWDGYLTAVRAAAGVSAGCTVCAPAALAKGGSRNGHAGGRRRSRGRRGPAPEE